MIDNPELGYTPANLKTLREKYNLTLQQAADITGTKNWVAVSRWETPVGAPNHADMPHTKWLRLLEHIGQA